MITRPSPTTAGWCLILFALGCLLLGPQLWLPVKSYDEGIVLTGAARIVAGETPYVDFWGLYPPGQFHVVALLLQLFGHELWITRLFDIAVKSLLACAAALLTRVATGTRPALWVWALTLLWLGYRDFSNYPVFSSLLLVLASQLLLLRQLQRGSVGALAASALTLVLAGLFRLDLAVLGGIAMLTVLLLHRHYFPAHHRPTLLLYGACTALLAGAIMTLLHLQVGLSTLFTQLIMAPVTLIPEYRSLPYPTPGLGPKQLPFYLVPAVLFCGLWLALRGYRRRADEQYATVLLLASLTGSIFLYQASSRSDLIHLLPAALYAIITGGLLLARHGLPSRKMARGALGLLLLLTFYKPAYTALKNFVVPVKLALSGQSDNGTGWVQLSAEENQLLDWLAHNTAATDTLYVGVNNHDRFTYNDVALYFFARRRPATRYHELHPGVTNTRAVQEEMIAELRQNAPAAIILAENFSLEQNRSAEDSGVNLLDEYIARHYQATVNVGKFVILKPRPPSPEHTGANEQFGSPQPPAVLVTF